MSSVDKVTDAVLLELENEGFEDQNRVTEVNLQKTNTMFDEFNFLLCVNFTLIFKESTLIINFIFIPLEVQCESLLF